MVVTLLCPCTHMFPAQQAYDVYNNCNNPRHGHAPPPLMTSSTTTLKPGPCHQSPICKHLHHHPAIAAHVADTALRCKPSKLGSLISAVVCSTRPLPSPSPHATYPTPTPVPLCSTWRGLLSSYLQRQAPLTLPRMLRPAPFDPTDIDGVHWPELFRPEVHQALLQQEGEAGLREREAASDPLGASWRVQVGCVQGGVRCATDGCASCGAREEVRGLHASACGHPSWMISMHILSLLCG